MKEIELINLELEEIRKATTIIDGLKRGFENMKWVASKEGKDVNTRINAGITASSQIKHFQTILHDCECNLNSTCNHLWEELNNCDAITGVDIALSKVPMELINRTKEEKDYE
mgnify:CR=1 FL=1